MSTARIRFHERPERGFTNESGIAKSAMMRNGPSTRLKSAPGRRATSMSFSWPTAADEVRGRHVLEVLGDGRQRKSYLYVQDCVSAILLAAERCTAPVDIFNLGTDEYCQVTDSIGWIRYILDQRRVPPEVGHFADAMRGKSTWDSSFSATEPSPQDCRSGCSPCLTPVPLACRDCRGTGPE